MEMQHGNKEDQPLPSISLQTQEDEVDGLPSSHQRILNVLEVRAIYPFSTMAAVGEAWKDIVVDLGVQYLLCLR